MVSTATFISTDMGKKKSKYDTIHFYWNWIERSIQLTASSWRQISISSWLYICISIRMFQLMWNICDCFFSLCSLSYYSSSACQEVLQSRVWVISSSFTLVINCLNHQFDQSPSIIPLVILLQIQLIRLDWSPSLLSSFAVLHVVMSPKLPRHHCLNKVSFPGLSWYPKVIGLRACDLKGSPLPSHFAHCMSKESSPYPLRSRSRSLTPRRVRGTTSQVRSHSQVSSGASTIPASVLSSSSTISSTMSSSMPCSPEWEPLALTKTLPKKWHPLQRRITGQARSSPTSQQ